MKKYLLFWAAIFLVAAIQHLLSPPAHAEEVTWHRYTGEFPCDNQNRYAQMRPGQFGHDAMLVKTTGLVRSTHERILVEAFIGMPGPGFPGDRDNANHEAVLITVDQHDGRVWADYGGELRLEGDRYIHVYVVCSPGPNAIVDIGVYFR